MRPLLCFRQRHWTVRATESRMPRTVVFAHDDVLRVKSGRGLVEAIILRALRSATVHFETLRNQFLQTRYPFLYAIPRRVNTGIFTKSTMNAKIAATTNMDRGLMAIPRVTNVE